MDKQKHKRSKGEKYLADGWMYLRPVGQGRGNIPQRRRYSQCHGYFRLAARSELNSVLLQLSSAQQRSK